MGDVAGSGGYYIAMGADRIFAEPGTITGSIGVLGGKVVLGRLYNKIGVTTEVISRGKNSGLLSSTEPFTPEQRRALTTLLKGIYDQFVCKAAQGRKINPEKLDELAQGRVYTGNMAKANGLIDELGTLRDAIAAAKKAAGMRPKEKVELLILPRPRTIFEQLFGDPSVSSGVGAVVPELHNTLNQLRHWRQLFAEPVLLWMPYRMEVR
jgi:protease-4